ncbi:MAG: NAD-dependent epimerase/dehydratase family protein [Bacteroidetes bacterium]|nr:NAD-dependent epimerase/dehydratase family protein [Bacteroidota bacterium]
MKYSEFTIDDKIKKLEGPIFVFGASGFIGANFIENIAKNRKDYYAITHDSNIAWRLRLLNIPFENIIHCDITSKHSVDSAFKKYNPKSVFNFAAHGAYSKQTDTNLIHETNYIGTLNILQACENVSCYIHAGTSSEYGTNCVAPKENEELHPNSHYAVSKASTNFLIEYFAKYYNVPAINLRLYSVYGKWEEPDRLIPRLIENVRKEKLPPFVSPEISRDFLYVTDCIEAFFDSALNITPEIYGESFNIASGKKVTIAELVELCRKEFCINDKPEWNSMNDRKWDLQDWYGNADKANEKLKWRCKTKLADGLKLTFDWQNEINYEENILPSFEDRKLNRKISCVIACYKDAQAIPMMYERLIKMFSELKVRYEIIFVNDCSPDNTDEVIAEICNKDSNVIGIKHSRNFGSQAAFVSGMEISTGDGVVLMDGDLQDPPEIIPDFYAKWIEGYEVVYGVRVKREMSPVMGLLYKAFYRIFSKLSYIKIPVDAGDFSLIDKKVVKELIKLPETEQFLRGLRAWVGFNQIGVPYVRPERMFGVSTNNWRKNIAWAKKAIFSFSFLPLEFLSFFGLVLTGISFLALITQVILKFIMPDTPQGLTTVIVLVLFFGGIQLLAVSIIGEYISKIFEETKKRPKFIRTSIRKGNKNYNTSDKIENFISERQTND